MASEDMTMGEVARTLERIERKLDAYVDDHEKRIRFLERLAYGALALGGTGTLTSLWQLFGGAG